MRAVTRSLATYALILGAAIIYGGRARFGGASYEEALQTPGAPLSWGVSLILAGVVAFTGTVLARPRVTAVGMYLGSSWCCLFAIAFARASLTHPEANNTAAISYAALAVLFAIAAGTHWARGRGPSLATPLPLAGEQPGQPAQPGQPVTSRHPLIVAFLLPLCTVSGISIMFRATPPPGSIEALIPRPGVVAWALFLAGGAALYLAAIIMQPKRPVTGVLLEQVAAVSLGVAATVYSAAAILFGGSASILPAGIIASLGTACLYRWWDLQRWVRAAKRASP